MTSEISRRGFLQGAGLAALGAFSATQLTGCGPKEPTSTQPKNVRTQSADKPAWLGEPPEIAEKDIT